MESSIIVFVVLALFAVALALIVYGGRVKHKAEEVTTDGLIKTAEDAIAAAQRLADARARSIAADQAALAADSANIAKARARLSGNAAPVAGS